MKLEAMPTHTYTYTHRHARITFPGQTLLSTPVDYLNPEARKTFLIALSRDRLFY